MVVMMGPIVGLCAARRVMITVRTAEIVMTATVRYPVPGGASSGKPCSAQAGEVMEAPARSNLSPGDLVVAVVRRPDYDQAADALARADPGRLAQLITRRVTPEAWPLTLRKGSEEIKIVIDMAGTV